ncbi:MAG TPA: hypothetical protein VKG78_09695 [Opitutaceae bacterium]|nr:hypothetical protein [Opitutaceae bacterium]
MNIQEAIQQHRQICDELYELALEENRFLQEHHRPPESALLDRKRKALNRLDEAITALRSAASEGARDPARRDALAKTQGRIMQILQIDRENEQLLMRHSLGRGGPAPSQSPERGLLQRIYSGGT